MLESNTIVESNTIKPNQAGSDGEVKSNQVTSFLMPCWLGETRMLIEELKSDEMGFYT